jgi:class 3 adenylate cyclase
MKRKGLRFQTRLMLALVGAITATTLALVLAAESKVAQAYNRQFSRDFQRIVAQLDRARAERSHEFMELSRLLAAHPFVAASIAGTASQEQSRDFWLTYLDALEGGAEPREDESQERSWRRLLSNPELVGRFGSLGVVLPNGEIRGLAPPLPPPTPPGYNPRAPNGGSAGNAGRPPAARFRQPPSRIQRVAERVGELLAREGQQVLFVPFEAPDGIAYVQEMVSTPVSDPATGRPLGLFLRAASAETEAQRFLDRFQDEFGSDSPLLTGIYLHGRLFSRKLPPETAERAGAVLAERLAEVGNGRELGKIVFESSLDGVPHRVYLKPLDGEGIYEATAWQVSAYSLAPLREDLAELRLRGSGVGLSALLFGVGIAWVFSRRLAVPVSDLTRATGAIKRGELGTRIAVRGCDELGDLAESFNEMAEGLQQRDAYRAILGKVSDETVAQAMVEGALDLELGGELKTVTVLFCDIRGFAALTEPMPPTEVIALLNDHMTAMTAVVRKHFGVVDKFVGDEIMAVFGGLKSYGNDAAHAAACALEMVAERRRLNEGAAHPLEIGVGLATGEAVAGCMGSIDRLNYTVVGSRVNLASRLCGEAGAMEVIIDDATREALGGEDYATTPRSGLRLKGFAETVSAYRLDAKAVSSVA